MAPYSLVNTTMVLLCLNTCDTILAACKQTNQYYLSKYGSDSDMCGNMTYPCGTLYFVSLCINRSTHAEFEVNIIDGQNKTEIDIYYQTGNTN
eukprot:546540_1